MRRRVILGGGLVIAVLAWWLHDPDRAVVATTDPTHQTDRSDTSGPRNGSAKARTGRIPSKLTAVDRPDDSVTITGTVIDRDSGSPVGNVEVVFRNPAGEESVVAGADGTYRIDVEPGAYRAFVRDETVLSFGPAKRVRIPTLPEAEDVGLPDEGAMSLVVASRDLEHVDLRVLRGGVVRGRVLDRQGRPIARAVVRATGQTRPVLGTDIVETDANGVYELVLPAGWWVFDAGHPRYAGVDGVINVHLQAGDRSDDHDLTLVAGCVISGRVVGLDGTPTGEGAIERGPDNFVVVGRINANGTFRWTSLHEGLFTIRAWPWKSPFTKPEVFACVDGARFDNVVLQVFGNGPDLEGTLADASGQPVTLAFIDLAPLDPGGVGQQERSDIDGKWAVFKMPAGRYRVTSYAPGRGVLSMIVTAPQANVRLAFGGTGRVTGTVKGITDGSFELRLVSCTVDGHAIAITEDTRIVGVRDGTFELDALPVCALLAMPSYRGRQLTMNLEVPAKGAGTLVLSFEDEPIEDRPYRPRDEPRDLPDDVEDYAPVVEGST